MNDPDYLINFPEPGWQEQQLQRALDNDQVIAEYLGPFISTIGSGVPPDLQEPEYGSPWWELRASWEKYPRWWQFLWRQCHENIASLERELGITRSRYRLPWESIGY